MLRLVRIRNEMRHHRPTQSRTSMLESLRHNRRLQAVFTVLFTVLLLASMLSGMRVRAADMAASPAWDDVCSVEHGPAAGERIVAISVDDIVVLESSGPDGSHHGPGCMLCIALAPPASTAVLDYQPPMEGPGDGWEALSSTAFSASRSRAPLPPRGPPVWV